jgi:SAM-dependent methyltransferase
MSSRRPGASGRIGGVADESVTGATQRFYDAIARRNPALAFMNYGYVDPGAPAGEMAADDLVAASRRLYEAVLPGSAALGRVLEVGCGRGAGAAFVLGSRQVERYLGLDLSSENIRMCRSRPRLHASAEFVVADARRLPVGDAAFDTVFSVEAAQHFEDRLRFYREVARALSPHGRFYFASIWRPAEVESPETMAACGLSIVDRADITANVVGSLARSGELRRQIVESLQLPERYTPLLMSWAGVRGHTAYEGLASGQLAYLRFILERA